jgi:hypothetical protein
MQCEAHSAVSGDVDKTTGRHDVYVYLLLLQCGMHAYYSGIQNFCCEVGVNLYGYLQIRPLKSPLITFQNTL